MFGRSMARLFGQHGLQISSADHLTGNFNGHLRDVCFLFADEAYWPGDKRPEGNLKRLITEPTLAIEQKGLDMFQWPNRLHVMMAANANWVVPATGDERRFAVFETSERYAMNVASQQEREAYFDPIYAELKNGGLGAMLYDLLRMDLGDWHPRRIYETAALAEQKALTRAGVDALIERLAMDGSLPSPLPSRPDVAVITGEDRCEGFYAAARTLVPSLKHSTGIAIGKELRRDWKCEPYRNSGVRGLIFPALAELRQLFEVKHGPQDWPDGGEEWDA